MMTVKINGNGVITGLNDTLIFANPGIYPWISPITGDINIKMWAGGGSGSALRVGGAGGYAEGDVPVVLGQRYIIVCAGGGKSMFYPLVAGYYGQSAIGNGGRAHHNNTDFPGAGGGLSGFFDGTFVQANSLLVAGGGGGAGVNGSDMNGGAGGGTSGVAGSGANPGGAGTSSAGGAGSAYGGSTGGALQGGNGDADWGSGGGGGYWGGGGGGESPGVTSAAGGGSGFAHGTVTGATLTAGSGTTPGNSSDTDLLAGYAIGGATYSDGGHGLVIVRLA